MTSAALTVAEALAARTATPGPRCGVGIAIRKLHGPDRVDFEEALADREEYAGAALARVLSTITGRRIAGNTLQRHRNGDCACPR